MRIYTRADCWNKCKFEIHYYKYKKVVILEINGILFASYALKNVSD